MGMWGHAAWDSDGAADWFGDMFEATGLAEHVEKMLKEPDVEEYFAEIRAAAYVLVALGRPYVWPVEDLQRHLKLAIKKLQAVKAVEECEGDAEWADAIEAEIAELKSRLKPPKKRR